MTIKRLTCDCVPAAIGGYSVASQYEQLIFTSGQLPMSPETNQLVEGIEAQAKQSLNNVQGILSSHCSAMANIIKTTIYLADMADFKAVDGVYKSYFEEGNYPSRTAIAVKSLPLGALVEIEVIAVATKTCCQKELVS